MNALLKISLLGLALVSTASMAGNFAGPEAGASVTMNGGGDNFYGCEQGHNFWRVIAGIQIARRLWI